MLVKFRFFVFLLLKRFRKVNLVANNVKVEKATCFNLVMYGTSKFKLVNINYISGWSVPELLFSNGLAISHLFSYFVSCRVRVPSHGQI